jgi:hypothetical protein
VTMLLPARSDLCVASSYSKSTGNRGSSIIPNMRSERNCFRSGFPAMETPDQYRMFAEECDKLAEQTENEHYRNVLREMAKEWIKLAEQTDARS